VLVSVSNYVQVELLLWPVLLYTHKKFTTFQLEVPFTSHQQLFFCSPLYSGKLFQILLFMCNYMVRERNIVALAERSLSQHLSTQDKIIEIPVRLWVHTKSAFKLWLLSQPFYDHLMNVSLVIM
jgi:hypothetical protein